MQSREFEKQWRRRFERFADNEDDAGIAGWSANGLHTRLSHFQSHWKPKESGIFWLDVGCGAGTYSRFLEENGKQVIALDYSLPTIKKARRKAALPTKWALADANRLPLAKNTMDGVLCFGVTQALSGSGELARELSRVVRGGGEVWVDGLNGECAFDLWARMVRRIRGEREDVRFESPGRLGAQLRQAGIKDLEFYWVPIFPASWKQTQKLFNSSFGETVLRHVPLIGRLLCHAFVIKGKGRDA